MRVEAIPHFYAGPVMLSLLASFLSSHRPISTWLRPLLILVAYKSIVIEYTSGTMFQWMFKYTEAVSLYSPQAC